MIVISAALVVVAFALLVMGIVLSQILLVYISIGVSALAALLLGVGAFRQRHELLSGRGDESTKAAEADAHEPVRAGRLRLPGRKRKAAAAAAGGSGAAVAGNASSTTDADGAGSSAEPDAAVATATPDESARTAPDIPPDAVVSVLPARRTYHLARCRQLRHAREVGERTYAEAREQGYTACGSCMPDTALAERRSSPEPASDADGATATGEETVQRDASEGAEPASGPSGADDADSGEDAEDDTAGIVGVVQGSHRYHRLTCAVVEDAVQDGSEMTTMGRGEAQKQDCTPCTVCRP